jgi:organic radical activating enzyme
MNKIARVSEIFESIQGEGVFTGARQVFVRFFGCGLSCAFCDTPQDSFREYDAQGLWREVAGFSGFHSISLTGGEPLRQADFLRGFLESARGRGVRIYLETNGVLPSALAQVIDRIDIVAMDLKLPSSTGLRGFWSEHEEFLKIARQREAFVKMVIGRATQRGDIARAADVISRVAPNIPVVLQPSWLDQGEELARNMAAFKGELAAAGLSDVRIMPQAHKFAGIR